MLATFLARYKQPIQWIHIALIVLLCAVLPVAMNLWFMTKWSLHGALAVFFLGLVGYSQNIGLMHEHVHRLPPGPRGLSRWVARFLYALGGLNFERGQTAHAFHHAFLGTSQDPDRNGYLMTVGLRNRLQYLLYIGPLRSKYAPVDLSVALNKMSREERRQYDLNCQRDQLLVVKVQLFMAVLGGVYYFPLLLSLIASNMCSNIREMTEHGSNGSAAYVNVKPSLAGFLFFSNPGFWFHGIHHMYPGIHYLDLPKSAGTYKPKENLPIHERRSYMKYLFTGA